ncbi:MAG: hypothetical protein WKF75_14350 [Singulisphaera sp.]
MPLRDATDYQFATPTRRVLVRESYAATAGVGLGEAARRYAGDLETFLGATGVTVAPEAPRRAGPRWWWWRRAAPGRRGTRAGRPWCGRRCCGSGRGRSSS